MRRRLLAAALSFTTVLSMTAVLGAQDGASPASSPTSGTSSTPGGVPGHSTNKNDPDQIGNRDVDKGVNFYSIEREMALGKALAQQFERVSQVVDDPVISEYVNRVGQNLARNSDSKFPLIIKVVRDDSVNAISLPGGFFFVNTGLLLAAGSESELAGAMAHEIAHIAARHATRQATHDQIANMGTIPLIFMGGIAGYGARQAAGVAGPLAGRAFSREFEAEADLLGLEYLYKAGYDPNGFIEIFEKIQALAPRRPGRVASLFSDHPATEDRIAAVQKNIQNLLKPQPQYVVNTSEFDAVKARLEDLQNGGKPGPPSLDRPTLRTRPDTRLGQIAVPGARAGYV